jgi:hypothetical protein
MNKEAIQERENNLERLKESVERTTLDLDLKKQELAILEKLEVDMFTVSKPTFAYEVCPEYKEFLKNLKTRVLKADISNRERVLKTDVEGVRTETVKIQLMKQGINEPKKANSDESTGNGNKSLL